jgi:outer membrane protein, heavy metal efflux system
LPVAALNSAQFALRDVENPPAEQELNIQPVQKVGLMNRLDVQRLLAEYGAAESDLRLQIARQYPDVALGPSYEFAEGANRYTIGPGLALPILNRNRGPIAEAEARRTTGSARFLTAQAAAITEMERALADYRSALRELEQAQMTLGLVHDQEQATERQLTAGELDRLALVSVRLEAAAADRARLAALRRAQNALGALEDALQHPLVGGGELPQPTPTNPREKKERSLQ